MVAMNSFLSPMKLRSGNPRTRIGSGVETSSGRKGVTCTPLFACFPLSARSVSRRRSRRSIRRRRGMVQTHRMERKGSKSIPTHCHRVLRLQNRFVAMYDPKPAEDPTNSSARTSRLSLHVAIALQSVTSCQPSGNKRSLPRDSHKPATRAAAGLHRTSSDSATCHLFESRTPVK